MTNLINSDQFNEEWAKEMEQYEITTQKFNQKILYHLKRYYNSNWKLDLDCFLDRANEFINKLFNQSWENNTFWNIDSFRRFLRKWLKLSILDYNLDFETSKKLIKSTWIFCYMYWEIVEFWEETTDSVKIYLEKNRNNEEKKEEIKQLVEKDYEIFFWEWAKWKTLNTKVWQTTNEIIEVFSNWYYGSLDNKDTTK